MQFFEKTFLGNTTRDWLIALAVSGGIFGAYQIAKGLTLQRLSEWAKKTETDWDDFFVELVSRTRPWVLAVFCALAGALSLKAPPPKLLSVLRALGWLSLAIQFGFWGNAFLRRWVERLSRKDGSPQPIEKTAFGMAELIGRIVLWSILLLAALDNLGVDITSLVAGLGVGGVAVALAVQNILGDVLCSVSIFLDKPFEIGDFIVVGDKMGTVERIGIKTTRLRSLGGEQLVFPNSQLVGGIVQNFKRMEERRVVFSLGVTYETPAKKLEQLPGIIREILAGEKGIRIDRIHFKSYGDFALIFEIVYYVLSADYNAYMDIQQRINFSLFSRFEKEGISFAYPTQTVYVQNAPKV